MAGSSFSHSMMRLAGWTSLLLASGLYYGIGTAAVPTWPAPSDELEDMMFLNTGYRARGFAVAVTPCSFSAQGNGRIATAEWIRTAFHDMATGNVFTGVGGLDASLMYELGGDNIGPAFQTTLETFQPFLTARSSMADIIALGMYTAVRSCGGPVVPIKTGRIDATDAGASGVPLPQNSLFTLQNQFARTGFNATEMIAVTACGHTLGGVHAEDFPDIVPSGTGGDSFPKFDTTTKFDNQVAVEWVGGKTADPLSVGPSVSNGRNSDARVFASDNNVTMKALTNPTTFSNTCSTLLQKMIEVVPSGTTLTDPIVVYEVKPTALQLTLLSGGTNLQFAGEIRVRTTTRPASNIASVQLIYKDRNGAAACSTCKITTTVKGTAAGFDDSFSFYGFSAQIPASTSISSFQVVINLVGGGAQIYGNNGGGFKVQDQIIFQTPQSCVSGGSLTVTAAVRSGSTGTPNLVLSLLTDPVNPSPFQVLSSQTVAMTQKSTVGSYTLYAATYTLNGGQASTTKFDVSLGTAADTFKSTAGLPATCTELKAISARFRIRDALRNS